MHRKFYAAALAVVLTSVGLVATSSSASALMKVKCKATTGTAAVDPIVRHNEPTRRSTTTSSSATTAG